jgi:phosphoribosylformylglycinamidine cyclo-ligase
VCDQLADEGISCILAGGETADVGDLVRTIIVDSTICARMGRDEVIDAGHMAPGDVIIGYASTGQARWEQQPNAGIGSNGLTGARHEVLDHGYADSYPETYAPEIAKELVYCGGYRLDAPLPGDDRFTVGSALLSPTRTYLPLIKELLGSMPRSEIHGLIHCSGGAQTKIGKFGSKLRFIKDGLPPVPPLFQLIQQAAGVSWQEMYSVYNMGVRLEVIVPEHQVETCLQLGTACGIPAGVIGRIEESSGPENEVVITSEHGEFHYAQH